MAKKIDNSTNLGYLGEDYQLRLVKCFIEDQDFFKNLYHVVDQNMFTNDYLRRIVGLMKDRYASSGSVPTYPDLDVLTRCKISDNIALESVLATLTKIRETPFDAIDIIEDEAERFFKQQNLIKAINKANDIIKKGRSNDYYVIEDIIKKALEVNIKQELGYCVMDNIEEKLKEDYRKPISTGCAELDESLYGGLGKGELGIIIAPLGVGKSSMTTGMSAAAATTLTELNNFQGFKVLHLFFEDKEISIDRKYFGNILDIDACMLHLPEVQPDAIKKLTEDNEINRLIRENVRAMRLRSGEVSASEIKNIIQRHICFGFKPDLVIIDYFECLKPENSQSIGDSEWSKEGITMRKLESICNEMNIAIWVPVQGTKGSIGIDDVGLGHAGGSVRKTQIGHVILSLAQTDEQKERGRLNLFIKKLRAAKIGRTQFKDVKFNNGTCRFDMSDLDDVDNTLNGNYQSTTAQSIAKNVKQEYRKNN